MKKQLLCSLLFLALAHLAQSQETIIYFTIKNNTISFTSQPSLATKLDTLPISLRFDNTFTNTNVSIYGSNPIGASVTPITTGILGSDFLTANGHPYYELQIKADSLINPDINSDSPRLNGSAFYLTFTKNSSTTNFGPFNMIAYANKYKSGLIFYDAMALEQLLTGPQNDSTIRLQQFILKAYGIMGSSQLVSNKYLNSVFTKLYPTGPGEASTGITGGNLLSNAASAVGGLDVTSIADGYAKFLVTRAKQELSIAFFTKFKTEISDLRFIDLQTVFPQTYRTLMTIDQIYMYDAYIQTLRESFEKDLSTLPTNLPTIIDNHAEFFSHEQNLKAILLSAFYLAQQIQNKQHPGNIIENYPDEIFDSLNTNIKASFQTLQLLSTSFKSNESTDNYWAPLSEVKNLYTGSDNDLLLKIYLGLLAQQSTKIIFIDKQQNQDTLSTIINNSFDLIATDLPVYKTYIKNFTTKFQNLETKITGLKKITNDSLLFENYYNIVSGTVDLMKYLTQVQNLPLFPPGLHLPDSLQAYFDMAQTAADIAVDVNRRNYSSAIVNASHLITETIPQFSTSQVKKLNRLNIDSLTAKRSYDSAVGQVQYLKALQQTQAANPGITDLTVLIGKTDTALAQQKITLAVSLPKGVIIASRLLKGDEHFLDSLTKDTTAKGLALTSKIAAIRSFDADHQKAVPNETVQRLLKYGSFMAVLVQAKNSDDVEAAIESVALPVGSYTVKQNSNLSISLNSYVGYGWDFNGGLYANGIYAPIGFAISKGFGSKSHCALTLFASIFDIGALVSYRLTGSTTDTLKQEVRLESIVSPSAQLIFGIPNTPIAICAGWRMTPKMFYSKNSVFSSEASKSALNLSVLIDIPLLTLYSRSY